MQQAADRITKLYTEGCNNNESDKPCYVNSVAYIPDKQTFKVDGGVVKIKVIEGTLEDIEVTGTKRLNPSYVRSRISLSKDKPLNLNKVREALRLLLQDPLIENIQVERNDGLTPGGSVLAVKVEEAKTWSVKIDLNNNRQPVIGSFEREVQINQANLLGFGDRLSVAYSNTDGSNGVDASYTLPLNPRNGTLTFKYSSASSDFLYIPSDFSRPSNASGSEAEPEDIEGSFQEYEITYRQPLIQTPTKEFALSLSATHRDSEIVALFNNGMELPLDFPGANENGEIHATILRFIQEWTQRSRNQVFAARSQLSLGIDALDANITDGDPDGEFFAWRGQTQWVRRLARDTLFITRGHLQLADRPLIGSEQIGVGGQSTVRGYRQHQILADNAFLASAELRYPIWRAPQVQGVLQVTPFVDFGTAWNIRDAGRQPLDPDTLASVGLGLLWSQQDGRLRARLDWGIPLVTTDSETDSWQESGVYFSITYNQPF